MNASFLFILFLLASFILLIVRSQLQVWADVLFEATDHGHVDIGAILLQNVRQQGLVIVICGWLRIFHWLF